MPAYVSQVWWTADGAVWTCATSEAAFTGRQDFVLLVFSGQLWLLGGYGRSFYYTKEVWASADGVQWVAQAPMPAPMATFAAVVLNSSILTTGYDQFREFSTIGVCLAGRPLVLDIVVFKPALVGTSLCGFVRECRCIKRCMDWASAFEWESA